VEEEEGRRTKGAEVMEVALGEESTKGRQECAGRLGEWGRGGSKVLFDEVSHGALKDTDGADARVALLAMGELRR